MSRRRPDGEIYVQPDRGIDWQTAAQLIGIISRFHGRIMAAHADRHKIPAQGTKGLCQLIIVPASPASIAEYPPAQTESQDSRCHGIWKTCSLCSRPGRESRPHRARIAMSLSFDAKRKANFARDRDPPWLVITASFLHGLL